MSQTISNFKDGFNGGTRANRFVVGLDVPTGVDAPNTTWYHVIAAKLPESELGSISVPYRGRIAHFAGDRDYKPWTVVVLDDTGSTKLWHTFQQWSSLLSNHATNQVDDKTYKAGVNLKTIKFKQLHDPTTGAAQSEPFDVVREVELYHAWPSEVGQIGFDMGEGGSLISFPVTFTYDYYKITTGI